MDGAARVLDQIPFVHADDERAAFALDQIGDAQVLLLERRLRIHQHDHHFGEADRIERVGDRELFELLLDPRLAPHARGVVDAKTPAAPLEVDRDGVARDAGFRPGEQTLLAEQPVDQRRLAAVRPADHRDVNGPRRIDFAVIGCVAPLLRRRRLGVCSGSAARSAS